MLDATGSLQKCTDANVVCEKTLLKDAQLCVTATSLPSFVALNATTQIQLSGSCLGLGSK